MGKMIFITGGARSGKSTFAENLSKKYNKNITYIATLNFIDEEMENRIEKHKSRRDSSFTTIEAYKEFSKVFLNIPKDNIILLDCVSNMLNNFLFEKEIDFENINNQEVEALEVRIEKEFDELLVEIDKHKNDVILVTNEVGLGLVPPYALGRIYRDILGRINQKLAQRASEVYFVVSGIPMKIKGDLWKILYFYYNFLPVYPLKKM